MLPSSLSAAVISLVNFVLPRLTATQGAGDIFSAMLAQSPSDLSRVGSISATASFSFLVPPGVTTLAGVRIVETGTITANDTNYWTFTVVNKGHVDGSGTTAMLSTSDLNTTKATGGLGLATNVQRSLTLHGTAANLEVAAGDVILVTATKASSAVTMADTQIALDWR